MPVRRMLRPHETMKLCSLSRSTFFEKMTNGELPPYDGYTGSTSPFHFEETIERYQTSVTGREKPKPKRPNRRRVHHVDSNHRGAA